jgi:hypothetical protein
MPLTPVRRSLHKIADGYTVFEQDQVLTADQLNSLAEYADDQTRLTRVRLLGIGVVCGLRVSLAGGQVRVTRGVGVTSDGDILSLDADTTFDSWRPYDDSRPAYPPLYTEEDFKKPMIPAFELIPAGPAVPGARGLGTLPSAPGGGPLDGMSVVFLMESYVRDEDLCSGTDCDNLGCDALHTPRMLLVPSSNAAAFAKTIATPAGAFSRLPVVVAERPVVPEGVTSPSALATLYRTACGTTHSRLADALGKIYAECGPFLRDQFPADPAPGWVTRLVALQTQFAGTSAGIQYYYDFLRDVADTYNEFRDHLFGDHTLCAPDVSSFAKHLLLGPLVPGAAAPERTGFYPSPLTGKSAGEMDHAAFLLRKLDALLARFQLPTGSTVVTRVTPSMGEDRTLEERAIPFYYQPGTADPIHRRWSYALARRGMDTHNYGYHAAAYGAQGGAANPLRSQIGRFPAFRVEGHVGRPLSVVEGEIETLIRQNNLPFAVRAVLLGTDRGKITYRPPRRFTDLHHVHGLVRKDVSLRLKEVERFSERITDKTRAGVTAGVAGREDTDRLSIATGTGSMGMSVKDTAGNARKALDVKYDTYKKDPVSWQKDLTSVLGGAAVMRSQIGHVARTEFVSPYDTLIGGTTANWLPWLDWTLGKREEEADKRLLFRNFVDEHPQLEHTGTVPRGGTLVLVYNPDNVVVADFALPYYVHEGPEEDEPVQPAEEQPDFRPDVLIDLPISIIPSRPVIFEQEWKKFAPDLKAIDDLIITQQGRLDDLIKHGQELINKEILSMGDLINEKLTGELGIINEKINGELDLINQKFAGQADVINERVKGGLGIIDQKFAGQADVITEKLAGQDKIIDAVGSAQLGVLRDSMTIASSITMPSKQLGDTALNGMMLEADALESKLRGLQDQLKDPTISTNVKGFIQGQIETTQKALGASAVQMATYLDMTQTPVTAGTDGARVVQKVGSTLTQLTGTSAQQTLETGLGSLADKATNMDLKGMLSGFGFKGT